MSRLVAIAGGSASGKSTLAEALVAELGPGLGRLVSEDWYYRDLSSDPGFDPLSTDFDDLSVRDHDLLAAHLEALRAGRPVEAPRYAFARHAREPFTVRTDPAAIVVVEGCHLLCSPGLAARFDLRIFVEAPDDIRLLRRLIRDQRERGRSLDFISAQYLRTVRPAHERLIRPSRARADLVVEDLSLRVEDPDPAVLSQLLQPVLERVRRLCGPGGAGSQG